MKIKNDQDFINVVYEINNILIDKEFKKRIIDLDKRNKSKAKQSFDKVLNSYLDFMEIIDNNLTDLTPKI